MKNPTRPRPHPEAVRAEKFDPTHPGQHLTPKFPGALRALGFVLLVGSVTLVSCQAALHQF